MPQHSFPDSLTVGHIPFSSANRKKLVATSGCNLSLCGLEVRGRRSTHSAADCVHLQENLRWGTSQTYGTPDSKAGWLQFVHCHANSVPAVLPAPVRVRQKEAQVDSNDTRTHFIRFKSPLVQK